jgi:hypothetical protein
MPLVGYIYFPELSELMNAYFGNQILNTVFLFVLFSFLFIIIFFCIGRKTIMNKSIRIFEFKVFQFSRNLGFLLLLLIIIVQSYIFILYYSRLNYNNINNDYFKNEFLISIFITLYKFFPGILIVLYDLYKLKLIKFFFWIYLITFLFITLKLGFKTDLVALLVGLMIYIYYNKKILFFSKYFFGYLTIFGILIILSEYFRFQSFDGQIARENILISIIDKDYFPPAHLLFASVYLDYVIPARVFQSNFLNIFPGLNFPYLQFFVTEEFNPGVTNRTSSYAYYVLTEGYNFMGFWGFIYNGFLGILLSFYRYLFNIGKKNFDICILSILGMNLVNLVRGQSVYFFKYLLIMDSIPLLILILLNGFLVKIK